MKRNKAFRKQTKGYTKFRLFPVMVSRDFRELILDEFPVLGRHEHAWHYWGILQYLMFSTFEDNVYEADDFDADKSDYNCIVTPYDVVAGIMGVHPKSKGFSAEECLYNFSSDVAPLDIKGHRYKEGTARSVKLILPPHVEAALNQEHERISESDESDMVCFRTGESASRRKKKEWLQEYEDHQIEMAELPTDHPAYELGQFLITQPQKTFNDVVSRNLPDVKQAASTMPTQTEAQRSSRKWNLKVLYGLKDYHRQRYVKVDGSPRIFAQGPSVNHLSRELRRMCFRGEIELDLKACQLAIVARLWGIPALQDLLESGKSIWQYFADIVRLPVEQCKSILKTTIYSIVFGMNPYHARRNLARGTKRDAGIGNHLALKFFIHETIKALLEARTNQLNQIGARGGAEDAYGTWRNTENKSAHERRSILAATVQSYEMQLMLSILPVLQKAKQAYLMSWLHDGVTLRLTDPTHRQYQIRQMQQAVSRTAAALRIATELEINQI